MGFLAVAAEREIADEPQVGIRERGSGLSYWDIATFIQRTSSVRRHDLGPNSAVLGGAGGPVVAGRYVFERGVEREGTWELSHTDLEAQGLIQLLLDRGLLRFHFRK